MMESTAAASSSASTSASANGKRKAKGSGDGTSALSPYKAKNEQMIRIVETTNATIPGPTGTKNKTNPNHYTLIQLNDSVLNLVPGKRDRLLDEYEVECLSELTSEQIGKARDALTQSQIDRYHHLMIVKESTLTLFEKHTKAIRYADTRFNSPPDSDDEDGAMFMMYNTYSSHLMLQVIQKQFLAATKEVNKATKVIKSAEADADNATPPAGIAEQAFATTFAATFASDEVGHWRLDTEDPESVVKIAKKIEKLWRDLLCFTDEELGLVNDGGNTRRALLQKLDSIGKSWKDDASDWCPKSFKGIQVKTAKNGQGMGRPTSTSAAAAPTTTTTSSASTPAAKKAKTVATVSPDAASPAASSSSSILPRYLSAIDDKIKARVKTNLQLQITSDAERTKSIVVVVSGATSIKKLNQICAYLTGHDSTFQYHSQKGKCLKGSRIELSYKNEQMWLCDKPSGKKAASAAAAFVEDKSIKVVQLFQGLNVNADDGIFYDSQQAKDFATAAASDGAVAWISPDGKRYNISVHCIVATKCVSSNELLPRVVKLEDADTANEKLTWKTFNMSTKTAFGMKLASTNEHMKGDRQGRGMWLMGQPEPGEIKKREAVYASRPLSEANGRSVNVVGEDRDDSMFSFLSRMAKKDVVTAGLPENGGVRAIDGASFVFDGDKATVEKAEK